MLCYPMMRSVAEVKSITIIAVLWNVVPRGVDIWRIHRMWWGLLSAWEAGIREHWLTDTKFVPCIEEVKLLFVEYSSAELWKEQFL